MKRIGNSKEPTIQRMLDMTSNLRDKFHKDTFINLRTASYTHQSEPNSEFWFSMTGSEIGEFINTWPEVLARYRELMNE